MPFQIFLLGASLGPPLALPASPAILLTEIARVRLLPMKTVNPEIRETRTQLHKPGVNQSAWTHNGSRDTSRVFEHLRDQRK